MAYSKLSSFPDQFEDANGDPLDGGLIEFYLNGTSTPAAVYADSSGTALGVTVGLNSRGVPKTSGGTPTEIYGDTSVVYKAILKDSAGGVIDTYEDIYPRFNDGAISVSSISSLKALSKVIYDTVHVTGYYEAGDGGGGHYWLDTSDTTSTDNGGTIIVATDGGRWKLITHGPVTLRQFGATGDGVTNDLAAIQNAVDAVLSVSGGQLFAEDGTYLISGGSITIPLYAGWSFIGESRLGTVIRQGTDNTPIFVFTKENAHSWTMSRMTLDYSNNQPSTNTAAIGIHFDFDTQTGSGAYLWGLNDIYFDKGYMLAATDNTAANLVWGMSIDRISTGVNVSGGCFRFDPNPNAGQPSIKIGHLYMRADAMTQPAVYLAASNGCFIDSFEINNATNIVALKLEGGSTVEIKEFKVENCDYTASNSHLIDFTDSQVNIGTFVLGNTTFTLGAGNKFYCFRKTGAGAAGVSVVTMSAQGNTLTSGDAYVFSTSADNTPVRIENMRSIDVLYLTDIASSAGADNCFVTEWGKPRISTDNGDADLTLAVGDETTQMFATTLTANRDVNLPPGHAANPSNLFNGLTYKIVRNAVTPGAFTLTVKNSAGTTIKQIPNSTNAAVEVTYRRGGWVLTNYTVL